MAAQLLSRPLHRAKKLLSARTSRVVDGHAQLQGRRSLRRRGALGHVAETIERLRSGSRSPAIEPFRVGVLASFAGRAAQFLDDAFVDVDEVHVALRGGRCDLVFHEPLVEGQGEVAVHVVVVVVTRPGK